MTAVAAWRNNMAVGLIRRHLPGSDQIEPQYRILNPFRLYDVPIRTSTDPNYVSDQQIIQDVAALIQAYLETLVFSQDATGQFNGSPYDVFFLRQQNLWADSGSGSFPNV